MSGWCPHDSITSMYIASNITLAGEMAAVGDDAVSFTIRFWNLFVWGFANSLAWMLALWLQTAVCELRDHFAGSFKEHSGKVARVWHIGIGRLLHGQAPLADIAGCCTLRLVRVRCHHVQDVPGETGVASEWRCELVAHASPLFPWRQRLFAIEIGDMLVGRHGDDLAREVTRRHIPRSSVGASGKKP